MVQFSRLKGLNTSALDHIQGPTRFAPSIFLLLTLLFLTFIYSFNTYQPASNVVSSAAQQVSVSKLPVYFIPNKGQLDSSVKFHAIGADYQFYLTDHGVTYRLGPKDSDVVRIELVGARSGAVTGSVPQQATFSYLLGNEPSDWYSGVPSFSTAVYENIYPGIDMAYSGSGNLVKYEYRVAPGADPSTISMRYSGVEQLLLTLSGDLLITTGSHKLVDKRPVVYQMVNGVRRTVEGSFKVSGSSVGFVLGRYDRALPLVIDPGLEYSTFVGGEFDDNARAILVDEDGNTYVAGETASATFPVPNGYDTSHSSGYDDAFVIKLNPVGDALVFGTFLGGSNHDAANDIALGDDGSIYVTGYTKSTNFPVPNGYRTTLAGGFNDAFAAKLGPLGNTLQYGTYLGGTFAEIGNGIEVDPSGNAYIVGETTSTSFPLSDAGAPTAPGYDTSFNGGGNDVFALKLGASGDSVVYRTYLGGTLVDAGNAVAVNASGEAFIAGETSSSTYPTTSAYDSSFNNVYDAVVTKLNAAGTSLRYSTFIGGSDTDIAEDIEIDSSGAAYIAGKTASTNFPTPNGYDRSHNGFDDAFVAKLSASGTTLPFGSFLGGSGADSAFDLALDGAGSIHVTGATASTNFPTKVAYDSTLSGYKDAFITKFAPGGSSLSYSIFFGGSSTDSGAAIAVDGGGTIHTAGDTLSGDLPIVNGFDTSISLNTDVYVARFTLPDGAEPDTQITSGPSGIISTTEAAFEWTGNDDITQTGDLVYSYMLVGYDAGWSAYGSSTSAAYSGLPNGAYTFMVKAKDLSGNEDQTPAESAFTVAVAGGGTATFEETDPNIVYSANCWSDYSNVLLSGGSAKIASKQGCTATFTFVGTQVDLISAKAKQAGKAKIYVDGVFQTNLDLYSASVVPQYGAFTAAALSLEAHTIKVEVLHTKNTKATGYYIPVDAFQVTS